MTTGIDTIMSRIATIESQISSVSARSAAPSSTASVEFEETLGRMLKTGPPRTAPATSPGAAAAPGTAGSAAGSASTTNEASVTATWAAAPVSIAAPASGPTGADVLETGKKYLGIPYVWGGTTTSGLDCSGLVQLTFKDLGIDLPRVSRDQAKVGEPVASIEEARPGDLIAFGSPVNHIAIYAGDGKILEAPQAGQDVHIGPIHRTPVAIRRVVPPGDGTAAVAAGNPVAGADSGTVGVGGSTSTGAVSSAISASSATSSAAIGATGVNGVVAPGMASENLMGIPPSLMVKFTEAQLAAVPRAIPVAALSGAAINPSDGAAAVSAVSGAEASGTADAGATGPVAGVGAAGLTAQQITDAGLSSAVAAFAEQFAAAEGTFNLPAGVLAAVAQAESGGRADAVSPAGAQGLMQIMPATAAALGVNDPFDPAQAITGAAKYLSDNLRAFDGSLTKALAAYNAGPGAVRKYGGVPPYAETQNYVRSINDMLARLT